MHTIEQGYAHIVMLRSNKLARRFYEMREINKDKEKLREICGKIKAKKRKMN